MSEFLNIATEAARAAGKYLLENRGKISPENIDEKAQNDFVTYVDQNSEKMIVDMLLKHFPDHKILAEEGTQSDEAADYRWIIDPLDGTRNYIQDVPMFAVSIALQKGREIILGVVYDPVRDELFHAEKNQGAFCNRQRIGVSGKNFSSALIATGFPFRAKRNLPVYLRAFEEIFLQCSGMRRCGSAAMDLCYTAIGRFEGFWEMGLSQWDIAAGSLLVKEAGGVVTDFQGTADYLESGFIIAGNPEAARKLLALIQPHFSK